MGHFVYIVSNANRRLYTGIASDLMRRVEQHRSGAYQNGFTARYNFDRLVYFEEASTQTAAARREKQIKGWTRAKKIALIENRNPNRKDLAVTWRDIFK
jgi:putative endonuclease